MLGVPGDYLAARKENPKDVYIINKDIMAKSYELVEN
jgi:sulfur transfer complex TusBCD TusB component (DsrH family)